MMTSQGTKVNESEVTPYTYNKEDGLIGWMDCSGSNLAKINEQIPGIVRIIATTRINHPEVRARERAEELGIANGVEKLPLVELDFRKYEEEHSVHPGDYFKAIKLRDLEEELKNAKGANEIYLKARVEKISGRIKSTLTPQEILQVRDDVCKLFMDKIYKRIDKEGLSKNMPMFAAGGMALLSEEFVNTFDIENVHPGDVTKYDLKGVLRNRRMIVGDGWIPPAKAISVGHELLCSSMHKMIYEMDAGPVYMRGYWLPIDYNYLLSKVDISDKKVLKQVGSAAQEALKHIGDHVIAGATFHDMFEGNWGEHTSGMLAYRFKGEWYLVPNGIMVDDHVANNPDTVFDRDLVFLEEKTQEFYKVIDEISKN